MKRTRLMAWCLSVAAVLLVGFAVKSGRTQGYLTQSGFKGLRGVYVTVRVNSAKSRTALTEAKIMAQVEEQLRKSGLKSLTKAQWQAEPGRPQLLITAGFDSIPLARDTVFSPVAYSYELLLIEDCALARNAQTVVPAATWHTGYWGTGSGEEILTQQMQAALDSFATAYANNNVRFDF